MIQSLQKQLHDIEGKAHEHKTRAEQQRSDATAAAQAAASTIKDLETNTQRLSAELRDERICTAELDAHVCIHMCICVYVCMCMYTHICAAGMRRGRPGNGTSC